MRTLLFCLIVPLFHLSLSAQDTWTDYVIGRPMVGHYDAKKAVAKEWGIRYKVIFAGCVLSDELSEKANAYQKSNQAYFEVLLAKYGPTWEHDFALDVKKESYRNSNSEKGTWYEIIPRNKNKDFYALKKEVAKTWGISYEAQFVPKTTPTAKQIAFIERLVANTNYVNQLENSFGPNWQDVLNKEVDFELAKQAVAKSNNVWIDCVVGKPYLPYIEAQKEVAKEWNINYEVQLKGCSLSKELQKQIDKIEAKNVAYFKLLEKNYGKDWNLRFNQAIQKKLAKELPNN